MKKRILSLMLCACLVLGLCPMLNLTPVTEAHAADVVTEFYYLTDKNNPINSMGITGYKNTKPIEDITDLDVTSVTVADGTIVSPTYAAKLESSTEVLFTPSSNGTLKIMFVMKTAQKGIKLTDGTNESSFTATTANTMNTVTVPLTANTQYTLTRNGAEAWIFYMSFTPDSDSSGGETTSCDHANLGEDALTSAKAASCTEDGNVAYYTCPVCAKYISAEDKETVLDSVTIPASHTWGETGVVTAPTCTEGGYTTYTCTVDGCGATEQRDVTNPTGHKYENGACVNLTADGNVCGALQPACDHANATAVAAKAATCQATGNKAYWYCADCNTYFSDEDCTTPTTLEDVTLPIDTSDAGHSWDEGEVTTAATCQTAGEKTYTCTLGCGTTKTEEIAINSSNHTWVDGEVIVAASCIADGEKQQTCGCGETQTVAIPAGHSYVDGVCAYHGTVLLDCGAVTGSKYIHNFTTDGKTDADGFFNIAGALDSTDLATVIYNGETLTSAIKMNKDLDISFTVPTNEAETDDYDGILILVGAESRKKDDGTFIITTLKVTVSDGTTTTEHTIAVPSDGIIMFAVTNGYTYTITKVDGENPLYYFEYVPGANLATVSDSGTGGETGGGETNPDDTPTGDGFVTFVAEIGSNQYLTLEAAVAAAKPGDTICLLTDTTETATIGDVLAVGESITIHMHGFTTGTITPAEGCTSTPSENADDGTDVITITRTEDAPSEGGDTTPDGVAYIDADKDDVYDSGEVVYSTVEAALAAAKESDIVRMLKASEETAVYLVVRNSVTLDLNGFQLTASGLSAFNGNHVIDSSETTSGLLVVPRANLILPQNNEELPVWNESNGYFFVTPSTTAASNYQYFSEETEGIFKVEFRPGFGKLDGTSVKDTYLKNGGADNGLTMTIQISWNGANGPISQSFEYTDDLFSQVYTNSKVFFAEIASMGSVQSVEINVVIVSETGVEFVGETMTWTASAE